MLDSSWHWQGLVRKQSRQNNLARPVTHRFQNASWKAFARPWNPSYVVDSGRCCLRHLPAVSTHQEAVSIVRICDNRRCATTFSRVRLSGWRLAQSISCRLPNLKRTRAKTKVLRAT